MKSHGTDLTEVDIEAGSDPAGPVTRGQEQAGPKKLEAILRVERDFGLNDDSEDPASDAESGCPTPDYDELFNQSKRLPPQHRYIAPTAEQLKAEKERKRQLEESLKVKKEAFEKQFQSPERPGRKASSIGSSLALPESKKSPAKVAEVKKPAEQGKPAAPAKKAVEEVKTPQKLQNGHAVKMPEVKMAVKSEVKEGKPTIAEESKDKPVAPKREPKSSVSAKPNKDDNQKATNSVTPDPKPAPKPEAKPVSKPAPKVESKPEPKPISKPVTKPDPKPTVTEPKSEPKPVFKPLPKRTGTPSRKSSVASSVATGVSDSASSSSSTSNLVKTTNAKQAQVKTTNGGKEIAAPKPKPKAKAKKTVITKSMLEKKNQPKIEASADKPRVESSASSKPPTVPKKTTRTVPEK